MHTGRIQSIMKETEHVADVVTSGNLRTNKEQEIGIPYFQLFDNNQGDLKDIILAMLDDDQQKFEETLVINKSVLDDNELLAAIRKKAAIQNSPKLIRIADEGYVLTREDFSRLSFAPYIAVDNCTPELNNENSIIAQNGAFKIDLQITQPVIERRDYFEQSIGRTTFHINHRLTPEEFAFLGNNIMESTSIELDYFDPDYYEEFLETLQHYTNEKINIQLIGYLLKDKQDLYGRLEKFPFEIDVVYSTCHDMIDMYLREPYTGNRLYYSQVEGGGKTSLKNYVNILNELTDFETLVNNNNYSPLEIAILAKMRIDNDYIYNLDRDGDYWDDTNLSQILNHEDKDKNKKKAICVGFSTLYSAYCRRCDVPMFRYSTKKHMRNIGRIFDEKYDVDVIGTADITWDLTEQNGNTNSYRYFMGSPREFKRYVYEDGSHEFLTIADVFSLSLEDFESHVEDSRNQVESFYHQLNYDPRGYAARLIELMDLAPNSKYMDIHDTVYNLCEKGYFEGIPKETLYKAITNVLRSLGKNEQEINDYLSEVKTNQNLISFGSTYAIGTNAGIDDLIDVITKDNVQKYKATLENNENRPFYIINMDEEKNMGEAKETPEVEEKEIIDKDDYVHKVIKYCKLKSMTVYDYYRNIGMIYNNQIEGEIPLFEQENNFITAKDIENLQKSDEKQIIHYFASNMMQTIEYNLTKEEQEQYNELFDRGTDNYVESLRDETWEGVKPRNREVYETDEEYTNFLKDFYENYFKKDNDYVQKILDYCHENNMNLYDYYRMIEEQKELSDDLKNIEQTNPFLTEEDRDILKEYTNHDSEKYDPLMSTYFSNTMMKQVNITTPDSKRAQLEEMLSDDLENYNNEIARMYSEENSNYHHNR